MYVYVCVYIYILEMGAGLKEGPPIIFIGDGVKNWFGNGDGNVIRTPTCPIASPSLLPVLFIVIFFFDFAQKKIWVNLYDQIISLSANNGFENGDGNVITILNQPHCYPYFPYCFVVIFVFQYTLSLSLLAKNGFGMWSQSPTCLLLFSLGINKILM